MNIIITVLLILGMFTITFNTQEGKKASFSIALITNIIVIILLWNKIFWKSAWQIKEDVL